MPLSYLTDRTSIETDWTCGTKLWWYKYALGQGIVPAVEADALRQGGDIHADLAFIAETDSPSESLVERLGPMPTDLIAAEVWARRVGWNVAWNEFMEPGIKAKYDTFLLEQEMVLDRDPLFIATTPDRGLIERDNKATILLDDYKSYGEWSASKWATHWPYAIQMHIQIAAVQEEFNVKVTAARVRGLAKGTPKDGKLRHPYVWAYSNGTDWQDAWKSGWELRPTWEHPLGIAGYVRQLGSEVAAGQFPLSQPIFLDERLLDKMLASEECRQDEIAEFLPKARENEFVRDMIFRPHFSSCKPMVGPACPYLAACHNKAVGDDPIGSGLFKKRTPHHALELLEHEHDENTSDLA